MHFTISDYQVQNMNVNHLKENIRKRKTSVWYKNILDERLLTDFKLKDQIYAGGGSLKKKQQTKMRGYTHYLFS